MAPPGIPSHGTKRTGHNTHLAADAKILVDNDTLKRAIAVNGIFGADFLTGGIFALLAAHGYINPDMFPFDNLDARQRGIAYPIMTDRANEFAISAASALVRIYCQQFLFHHFPLGFTRLVTDISAKNSGLFVHFNERLSRFILSAKNVLSSNNDTFNPIPQSKNKQKQFQF